MNPYHLYNQPLDYAESPQQQDVFDEFDATELYCPNCRAATPIRKRLLLILPEGEKYEYLCAYCSESVGSKISKTENPLVVSA